VEYCFSIRRFPVLADATAAVDCCRQLGMLQLTGVIGDLAAEFFIFDPAQSLVLLWAAYWAHELAGLTPFV